MLLGLLLVILSLLQVVSSRSRVGRHFNNLEIQRYLEKSLFLLQQLLELKPIKTTTIKYKSPGRSGGLVWPELGTAETGERSLPGQWLGCGCVDHIGRLGDILWSLQTLNILTQQGGSACRIIFRKGSSEFDIIKEKWQWNFVLVFS